MSCGIPWKAKRMVMFIVKDLRKLLSHCSSLILPVMLRNSPNFNTESIMNEIWVIFCYRYSNVHLIQSCKNFLVSYCFISALEPGVLENLYNTFALNLQWDFKKVSTAFGIVLYLYYCIYTYYIYAIIYLMCNI